MRTIAFLVAVLGIGCITASDEYLETAPQGILENLVNRTLNKILANLSDPLILNSIAYKSDKEPIVGFINASKPAIVGIKRMVASYIDVGFWSHNLNMTIDIPELIANFKYEMNLVLQDLIPVYGKGLINANFENIRLQLAAHADFGDHIQMQNLTVYIYIDKAVFNLNGILDNPEFSALLNNVLNDNLCPFLNSNAEVVSKIISPIAEVIINNILAANDTSSEFLEEFDDIKSVYELDEIEDEMEELDKSVYRLDEIEGEMEELDIE